MLEQFWAFIASAVVVVGAIMGAIKSGWKPKVKELYLIPAAALSMGASYLAFIVVGTTFVWYLWLGSSFIILGDELLLQNDMWPGVTTVYAKIRDGIKSIIDNSLKKK